MCADNGGKDTAKRGFILGSANWDMIAPQLRGKGGDILPFDLSVTARPFGQYLTEIYTPQSALFQDAPDFLIFAERFEDFLLPLQDPRSFDAHTSERFATYIAAIEHMRAQSKAVLILHEITLTRPLGFDQTAQSVHQKMQAMNDALRALARALPDCHFLGVSGVVQRIGQKQCDPGKYWLIGRLPFGAAFAQPYKNLLFGLLLSLYGKTTRVLVLDLDNTLWGGAVGDDGLNGIQLGTDFPGNQFVQFQNFLRPFLKKGIIFAICSKNFEQTALDAIGRHKEMVLRPDDFVAWQINWGAKSDNIRRLSEELDVGLSNFMFIDDNPIEREDVRGNCPEVIVPEMPLDVTEWPAFLAAEPHLYRHNVTEGDVDKTEQYAIRRQVEQLRKKAPDRTAFLQGLGMSIEMSPMEETSKQRVLQLIQKTNQFNTTAKRYLESDLEALRANGGEVLSFRIKDKYGSDEIIAVAVLERSHVGLQIAAFIMSCRVMGRGVETAALALICEYAAGQGDTELVGLIHETERNLPCRDLFARHNFSEQTSGRFYLSLETGSIARPNWFSYMEPKVDAEQLKGATR